MKKDEILGSGKLTASTGFCLIANGLTTLRKISKLDIFDLMRMGLEKGEIKNIEDLLSANGYSLKPVPRRKGHSDITGPA